MFQPRSFRHTFMILRYSLATQIEHIPTPTITNLIALVTNHNVSLLHSPLLPTTPNLHTHIPHRSLIQSLPHHPHHTNHPLPRQNSLQPTRNSPPQLLLSHILLRDSLTPAEAMSRLQRRAQTLLLRPQRSLHYQRRRRRFLERRVATRCSIPLFRPGPLSASRE